MTGLFEPTPRARRAMRGVLGSLSRGTVAHVEALQLHQDVQEGLLRVGIPSELRLMSSSRLDSHCSSPLCWPGTGVSSCGCAPTNSSL